MKIASTSDVEMMLERDVVLVLHKNGALQVLYQSQILQVMPLWCVERILSHSDVTIRVSLEATESINVSYIW